MKLDKLSFEKAVAMLPESDTIHTFVNPGASMLIGADWSRKQVLETFKKFTPELSGKEASSMKHGIVIWDGKKHVFFETTGN